MSESEIRFSVFNHAKDGVPKPQSGTWDQFVAWLGEHKTGITDKKKVPMFSPCEFQPGMNRLDKFAVKVWFGVLDLDLVNSEQLLAVCAKLEGLDAVLYTTWRHPEAVAINMWRVRVCVRLSRPIEPPEWLSVWHGLTAYFCGLNDPQDKNIGRCYFVPAVPPGTLPQYQQLIVFKGNALNVATLATNVTAGAVIQTGTQKITRERLERLAVRWKRSREPYRSEMGEVLHKVCKGEVFAEKGGADNAIFQLMSDLAKAFPDAAPDSVAEHFAQSLQIMGPHRPGYEGELVSKFERAQERVQGEAFAAELAETSERKLRIRSAFAHIDPTRETAYSAEELADMADACKCTLEELTKRWLIQRGSLFYILGPRAVYSQPYTEKDVYTAVLRDLAPADSAGVDLWTETATGEMARKSLPVLMADYGSVATEYVLDMRAQSASYDASNRLFIEAPCPRRLMVPTYDHDVATWLEVLTGEHHQNVLNWIAQCTNLDLTCAALLFTGKKDTGKSLLAMGLSRIWTTNGPTPLTSAMGDFNDAMARCPLVFADEQLPKDFRGHGRTAEIREFLSARARPFKKKFYPEASILGTVRLMVAANNENILAIQEHLSAFDIEAIGDRFYHVPVDERAAEWLTYCDPLSFIIQDRIAKHALWLRDNYPIRQDGRFIIKSPNREFYRGLATQSGMRSALCQWFVSYLKAPIRIDSRGDFGALIRRGKLYVSPATVLDSWDVYVKEPCPGLGRLSQSVAELSLRRTSLSKPRGMGIGHYREIDVDHLYAWSERTEFASREEIDAALAIDTESRIPAGKPAPTFAGARPN